MTETSLKLKTARTLKWNTIDRVATQVLYAVVGVVLANMLSQEDFGLVGALLVFQAFATILTDSGLGAALLQKKDPTDADYSTVFWVNLVLSVIIYAVLWIGAPLIPRIFRGAMLLIPLSKVMFLSFVINGLAIVQVNKLMKRMDICQLAVANILALTGSGVIGIWLALDGYGPWAMVWQNVSMALIKCTWLWLTGHWWPGRFHLDSLRSLWRVGISILSTSALNTFCQHIYTFIIGVFYSMRDVGIYTQADKWSKMGSASISQILTASFVPLLSRVQDDAEAFRRYVTRANRFTAFILFPTMLGLTVVGAPLFHTLFGHKWDAAILLIQILTVRGIFDVLISLCTNYLLALGYGRTIVVAEACKDILMILAIFATVFADSVPLLVWGQLIASVLTYAVTLWLTCRHTPLRLRSMLTDLLPSFLLALLMSAAVLVLTHYLSTSLPTLLSTSLPALLSTISSSSNSPTLAPTLIHFLSPLLTLLLSIITGLTIYLLTARLIRLPELTDLTAYLRGRLSHP
ncbi:MAG: lipopolysaccharide biosynthesis protein [Muribaculaceae bacterium]|nr:lipopolysaccharide biosynthesis protein [Muribaculaceae bacterium]